MGTTLKIIDNRPVLFLDIDGVLNCDDYFQENGYVDYKHARRVLRGMVKSNEISGMEYYSRLICRRRLAMFSALANDLDARVIVSSSWRIRKSPAELQSIFDHCGGAFDVSGRTEVTGYERGTEISLWIRSNISVEKHGCAPADFVRYAIIDDGDDMLMSQGRNFFRTSREHGLTEETCDAIRTFLRGK